MSLVNTPLVKMFSLESMAREHLAIKVRCYNITVYIIYNNSDHL